MLENMMNLVTRSGEKHGIINRVANSVKENPNRFAEKDRVKMKSLREEDERIVKVRYMNYRGANERLSTPYCKWEGSHIDSWHFIPDCEYEVPMGLVKQVNDPSKRLARRSEVLDTRGIPTKVDGSAERIHELLPISF